MGQVVPGSCRKDKFHRDTILDGEIVNDILADGTVVIYANIAGYSPRPFQKNWTGRDGPFVYIIGQDVIDRFAKK